MVGLDDVERVSYLISSHLILSYRFVEIRPIVAYYAAQLAQALHTSQPT